MADEFPSNADLAWRIDRLQGTLNGVVGHPEYAADKRGTDQRLTALENGLAEAKRNGFEEIRRVDQRQERHEQSHQESGSHRLTLLWTGIIPVLIAAIGVIVTLYLNGGH